MPQMAPLNWLTLMIVFITIMAMMNALNYFMSLPTSEKTEKKMSNKKLNWKW